MAKKSTEIGHDGINAASGAMGIPVRVLRFLKSHGAQGFRSNRVYEAQLRNWIEQHPEVYQLAQDQPPDEGPKLNPLQKKQMELLDVKIKRETGELISKEALATASQKCFGPIVEIARRHLAPDTYNTFCKEVREAFERLALEAVQSPADGN